MSPEKKANVLESIRKTNAARKGVPRSEEEKRKMSLARRAGVEARKKLAATEATASQLILL